jgi:hypothetical protein
MSRDSIAGEYQSSRCRNRASPADWVAKHIDNEALCYDPYINLAGLVDTFAGIFPEQIDNLMKSNGIPLTVSRSSKNSPHITLKVNLSPRTSIP